MAESWDRLLTRWTDAGLLDKATASRIRAFEETNAGSSRLRWPIWLALGFGALALGAGVLLFVSAHWDSMSPGSRFGLVLALVAVFHAAGALAADRFHAMATAFHAVGTIALGAGIFLAGQIFNLAEHWPGGLMLSALGAGLAWAILKSAPQMLLFAVLAPAWLAGEWMVAAERYRSPAVAEIVAAGVLLLALAYFTAVQRDDASLERKVLARLGGFALPFGFLGLAAASYETWSSTSLMPVSLAGIGWTVAIGLPLLLATYLRRRDAWPLAAAAVWVMVALNTRAAAGELALYAWWGLGATGLAAWGVVDARSERINMGAAVFAATVLAFYFSQVMDKLGRSASLVGLGLVFLAGGWGVERLRRRLVLQARGAQ